MTIWSRYPLFLILNLTFSQVHAMGLLDLFTIHVFSDVSGVVTLNSEPVEGAEIIRTADHKHDKVYTDSAKSDKDGKFFFKDISTFSLRPIMLPTIIEQKIIIRYKGLDYLAWETTKWNNHKYGELNDEDTKDPIMLSLSCELTDDQAKYEVIKLKHGKRRITGLCNWH